MQQLQFTCGTSTFGLSTSPETIPFPKEEALPHGMAGLMLTSLPKFAAPKDTTECALPLGMKKLIVAQPGFPRPIPSPTSPAHTIAPASGADLGMFATRNITAGELVFAERAFVIAPLSMPGVTILGIGRTEAEKDLLKHREALLERLLGRMSHENATELLALANSRTHATPHVLHGILETNAWAIIASEMRPAIPGFSVDSVFRLGGTCAVLSRINHSPNAVISFDISSFSFALRVASDARRKVIATSEIDSKAVGMALMDISQPVDYLINRGLRILRLITEEGLQSDNLYRNHLAVLGLAYASLGNRERYLWAYARISEVNLSNAEMEALSAEDKLIWTFYPDPENYAFWDMRLRIKAHEQGK
ncbi:hypothetical protein EWM64_g6323 [Hericium alpestre]|uniref:Uncharacterized protein n=1 Tax=Hericium alpestre TaxID=135208 RepID=A0A4Y9ZUF1_9AGAM|nr:hypothetical protein EWM64_g6323 [Hericium alpestre]